MGFGDVKMLAMVGAFLGIKLVLLTFVLSSMIGGARRRSCCSSPAKPIGRPRCRLGRCWQFAALVASLVGEPLLCWYFAIL